MTIYQPWEDSYLLKKYVREFAFGRVLDMGTGSGIQALTAITNPNCQHVLAVDKDEEAVQILKEKAKKEKIRKLEVINSDLFSNVKGQFNLIIFNPPYLPQDKGIQDDALYGGKKGWELAARLFHDASKHLYPDGKILFLFSSLTNKAKIQEILEHSLFSFTELEKQKLSFEELYLYCIEKKQLLWELEKKGIQDIHYFAHGKRGTIFTGLINQSKFLKSHLSKPNIIKVAIKAKKPESKAQERIENEARWLKGLNKEHIGPYLLWSGENYIVYRFVEGDYILDWIPKNSTKEIKKVLIGLLHQCFGLDQLGINKEEMHHPVKHIIIDKYNQPILIDFERCYETKKPQNVTQFLEFICRIKGELDKKGISIDIKTTRKLAQDYKKNSNKESFQKIVDYI